MYDYDACFIYHPNERQFADALMTGLTQDAHLRIVPYIWPSAPIQSDAEQVDRLLEQSASAVLLFGGSAFPPLDDADVREKLSKPEAAKSLRTMILVLLPGSNERLQSGEYVVDLREDSAEAMSQLVAAIVGHTPSSVRYTRDPYVTNLPDPAPSMSPSISGVFLPVPSFTERPEMDTFHAFWRDQSHGGVLALVGIGGSGKTALLTRLLQELPDTPLTNPVLAARNHLPSPRGVFVWSMYDEPNIEYFVRGLYTYLTDIPTVAPARDVVYRLIRHIETTPLPGVLVALDGLEVVQEDRNSPGGFGLLRDSSLRHFVRAVAASGTQLKLIVTSRYPLPELTPFAGVTYHEIDANQVADVTARAFLRTRGVYGTNAELDAALSAYGNHLLTLDLLGRLINTLYKGDLKAVLTLPDALDHSTDAATDMQAVRLARVLAAYNASLPPDALVVLRVLSVLRSPVTVPFLLAMFQRVDNPPFNTSRPIMETSLREHLVLLRDYGLIAFYGADMESACVTHPAIAAYFLGRIDKGAGQVHALLLHKHINRFADFMMGYSEFLIDFATLENDFSRLRSSSYRIGLYRDFAWQRGDYERGIFYSTRHVESLQNDPVALMASDSAPAHEHNLFLTDLGRLVLAEQGMRVHLERIREITARPKPGSDNNAEWSDPDWGNGTQQEYSTQYFGNYEGILIQTLFDTLFAQGKLIDAHDMIHSALSVERNWSTQGASAGGAGSNPYARRALVRSFLGDISEALADYRTAARTAAIYGQPSYHPSTDWHFKPFQAEFLARLGHLSAANRLLRRMNYAHINATRPLTAACYNLAAAQIAYLHGDDASALPHIEAALGWAMQSGHQHTYLQALIVRARLHVRAAQHQDARALLTECIDTARTDGYALQQIDALMLLAHVALRISDVANAQQHAEDALGLSQTCTYCWGEGDAAHALASAAYMQADYKSAMQYAAHAHAIRSQSQDPRIQHTQALIDDVILHL